MKILTTKQLTPANEGHQRLAASILVDNGAVTYTRCPYCGSDDVQWSDDLRMPHGYVHYLRCNNCPRDLGTAEQQTEAILAAFRAMQEQEVA
jgi:hypothetical protein